MTTVANSGYGSWWKFSEACKGSWKIWMRKQPGSGFNQDRAGLLQHKKLPTWLDSVIPKPAQYLGLALSLVLDVGLHFFRISLKVVRNKKILKMVERKFIPTALTEK